MRIEDMLNDAMLRGIDGLHRCRRCLTAWQPGDRGWRHSMLADQNGQVVASCDLCRACVKDFEWFLATPPPAPDTSSGDTLETKEVEHDAENAPN